MKLLSYIVILKLIVHSDIFKAPLLYDSICFFERLVWISPLCVSKTLVHYLLSLQEVLQYFVLSSIIYFPILNLIQLLVLKT